MYVDPSNIDTAMPKDIDLADLSYLKMYDMQKNCNPAFKVDLVTA